MTFNVNKFQHKQVKQTVQDQLQDQEQNGKSLGVHVLNNDNQQQIEKSNMIPSGKPLYMSQQLPTKKTGNNAQNTKKTDIIAISQGLTNISETASQYTTNIIGDYTPFKVKYDINKRVLWANEAFIKFPSKIPIIIEMKQDDKSKLPRLPNPKFLIPKIFSISELMLVIRDKLRIDSRQTLICATGKIILKQEQIIETVYNKYKDIDGFLYVTYMEEYTFG